MRVQQHLPTADSEEYFLLDDEDDRRARFNREDGQVKSSDIRGIDGTVTKYSKT